MFRGSPFEIQFAWHVACVGKGLSACCRKRLGLRREVMTSRVVVEEYRAVGGGCSDGGG